MTISEKAQLRKARALEKATKDEIDAAVSALLSSSRGRKYLWWLLQIGRVGTQPFALNALQTSFACGELNVGQQILAHILEVDPAGYVRMMQEQADDRRTDSGSDDIDDSDTGDDTE